MDDNIFIIKLVELFVMAIALVALSWGLGSYLSPLAPVILMAISAIITCILVYKSKSFINTTAFKAKRQKSFTAIVATISLAAVAVHFMEGFSSATASLTSLSLAMFVIMLSLVTAQLEGMSDKQNPEEVEV